MREYDHQRFGGEILRADKKSLKAGYGSDAPEAYDPNDPRFLKEVKIDMGNMGLVPGFVVSKPSTGWENRGILVCDGVSVVEVQQQDGGYTEMGVHESRIKR